MKGRKDLRSPFLLLALLLALLLSPALAHAGDIVASAPRDISATIYRAPDRNGGSIALDNLGGFALITETRTVHLKPGENRLLFEGVADGIVPESAIVTGLPDGVIEKNRDAAVLSPDALMRAAVGSELTLRRANRKTGNVQATPVTLRSASVDGVVFKTADGVETLRCSGAPETFSFGRAPAGLTAVPMLSANTRSKREITATVTLSYLAQGFDWSADYTATVNPDGKTLDLGAWITLANGNGVGFPGAHTQIVAGRLNRVYEAMWIDPAPRVIATCWPMETTSDVNPEGDIDLVRGAREPEDRADAPDPEPARLSRRLDPAWRAGPVVREVIADPEGDVERRPARGLRAARARAHGVPEHAPADLEQERVHVGDGERSHVERPAVGALHEAPEQGYRQAGVERGGLLEEDVLCASGRPEEHLDPGHGEAHGIHFRSPSAPSG